MATYASLRDIQLNARAVLGEAMDADERHVIVTSHGKPVAVMLPIEPGELTGVERALRSWQLKTAAEALRAAVRQPGTHPASMREINSEITRARRERSRAKAARHGGR